MTSIFESAAISRVHKLALTRKMVRARAIMPRELEGALE
jgi:hypothetical protein